MCLQLFIVLMAFFPIVLFGMLRRPNVTLAGSAALYLAARVYDWNLSSFPDGRWYFNPFCWQLLFVLGAWFALSGARQMRAIRSLQDISALRIAALLYLLFALVVTAAGKFPLLAEFVPEPVLHTFLPNDKENLAPYRVIHFLALAFLFTLVVPRDWRGFRMGDPAACHQVRGRMAAGLLRRRIPFLCRPLRPDNGAEFACDARSRQHRRDIDHDRRRLLCVVVQAAGLQACAQHATLTRAATGSGR